MIVIVLDASAWRSTDDFYDALLPALGAPAQHARSLDALAASIAADDINRVLAPFQIRLRGADRLPLTLNAYVLRFVELVDEIRIKRRLDVEARVEP
jgi:RNAse (barnase) inhibitor barstar